MKVELEGDVSTLWIIALTLTVIGLILLLVHQRVEKIKIVTETEGESKLDRNGHSPSANTEPHVLRREASIG
jgi:uncharacterized membrane protein YecN with MAPEG domain